MPILSPLVVLSLLSITASPVSQPMDRDMRPVCGMARGVTHVALTAPSCCLSLPCERPLSFGDVSRRLRAGRT